MMLCYLLPLFLCSSYKQLSNLTVFPADGWLAEAESCAKAALYLCEHVRNQYSVPLMTEVIVERELLSIQLRMEEPDIADILRRYEGE